MPSLSIIDTHYEPIGHRPIDDCRGTNDEAGGTALNKLMVPLMAVVFVLMEKLMADAPGARTPPEQGPEGEKPTPGQNAAGKSDLADPQSPVRELLQALSKLLKGPKQPSSDDPAGAHPNGSPPCGHDKQDRKGASGGDSGKSTSNHKSDSIEKDKVKHESRDHHSSQAPSDKSTPKDNAKNRGADAPAKASQLPPATGEKIVNEPIVVKAGEVFDGKGVHFKAGPGLGDGGQSEHQKPVFILEPGAQLKNVQISGADGVHAMGDAKLTNVWWRDVGEDAFTMKGPGNVEIEGGGAFNATDKIFQLNHGGSFSLNNFTADTFGKAIRTNGGKDFPIDIRVTNSFFSNGKESVVRTDATQASIYLANNTIENTKWDVLAPDEAKVVGATRRGWKDFTG
jgi:hypothetical protein